MSPASALDLAWLALCSAGGAAQTGLALSYLRSKPPASVSLADLLTADLLRSLRAAGGVFGAVVAAGLIAPGVPAPAALLWVQAMVALTMVLALNMALAPLAQYALYLKKNTSLCESATDEEVLRRLRYLVCLLTLAMCAPTAHRIPHSVPFRLLTRGAGATFYPGGGGDAGLDSLTAVLASLFASSAATALSVKAALACHRHRDPDSAAGVVLAGPTLAVASLGLASTCAVVAAAGAGSARGKVWTVLATLGLLHPSLHVLPDPAVLAFARRRASRAWDDLGFIRVLRRRAPFAGRRVVPDPARNLN